MRLEFGFLSFLFLTVFLSFAQEKELKIYVSDAANFNVGPWKILKYDADGSNPQIFTTQQLAWPQDILFLEAQGVALISNLSSGTIGRYDAVNGEFKNVFASGVGGPTRMKIGADHLIYVLQWDGNGKVRRYQQNGDFVDEFTSAGVDDAIGMDWDQEGNLYVSSYTLDLVRKFDSQGKDLGNFISTGLVGPTNIWFSDEGDLYVSDFDGGAVKKFNSQGKNAVNFITGLGQSEGIAFMDNGDLLVGNGASSSVKQYTSAGQYIKDVVTFGKGGLKQPNAVVLRMEVNFAPEIEAQAFDINEHSPRATLVGTVVATDPNNDFLNFSITSGNESGAFTIGSTSGRLVVADESVIDFETVTVFELIVSVTDNKSNVSAVVTISVIDIDESLLDIESSNARILYPNPARDFLLLQDGPAVTQLIFYGLDGSQVANYQQPERRIDIQSLKSGIYLAVVQFSDGATRHQKVVIGGR